MDGVTSDKTRALFAKKEKEGANTPHIGGESSTFVGQGANTTEIDFKSCLIEHARQLIEPWRTR